MKLTIESQQFGCDITESEILPICSHFLRNKIFCEK